MILIIIALIAIFRVSGFFSIVGWLLTHFFDILDWIIIIPIVVISVIVAVFILVIIYWLASDLVQWISKKMKKQKAQAIIKRYKHEWKRMNQNN